ncbi:MAG: putative PDDEXK endonuclease, partial [Ignavibacterium sp.]
MVNQKQKGKSWERELVELLSKIPKCAARRIAGSGAFGTQLNEPTLMGDVILAVDDLPKKFRIECKVGYGNEHQMTIKREWFDKIRQEAENSYSIPLVALKLSGVREKNATKYIIAMDLDTFIWLISYI